MKVQKYPISRESNIVIQETKGEVLIYDLKTNEVFCLNPTSAKVWNTVDGKKSVPEIAKVTTLPEEMVCLALDQLNEEKLILNYEGSHIYFNNLSRREIIKRVGLASMIVLPMITAITAPSPAQASSCVADLQNFKVPGTFDDIFACQVGADNLAPSVCCSGSRDLAFLIAPSDCQGRCGVGKKDCLPSLQQFNVSGVFANIAACEVAADNLAKTVCCSGKRDIAALQAPNDCVARCV